MLPTHQPERARVLVVDDHADTVDSTATVLRLYGHEVATATSGPDAIACVTQFQPQVALLDLAMPGMDGFETAREIGGLALSNAPILIAVSGYGDAADKRRAAEAGFDLHLLKPIPPSVFAYLPVLANGASLDARAARLTIEHQEAVTTLAASHIQMANALLSVAATTSLDATRERCIAGVRRICDRLDSWIRSHPYLRDLQPKLDALISCLRN